MIEWGVWYVINYKKTYKVFLLRFSIFTIQGKGFYQAWSNTSHDWNWTVSTLMQDTFFAKYIYCHLKKVTWKLIVISKILKNPLFNPTICPNGSVNSKHAYLPPPPFPTPGIRHLVSPGSGEFFNSSTSGWHCCIFNLFHLKCSYLESYKKLYKEYF